MINSLAVYCKNVKTEAYADDTMIATLSGVDFDDVISDINHDELIEILQSHTSLWDKINDLINDNIGDNYDKSDAYREEQEKCQNSL